MRLRGVFTAFLTATGPAGILAAGLVVAGAGPAAAGTHANPTAITIPATGTSGVANPYPSSITVAGESAVLTKVTVTLTGFSHTFPDEVDVLLVGPSGTNLIVMSDVGGGSDASGLTLTLDDDAATALPDASQLTTGTFKPSNIGGSDTFAPPAPAPSAATALSTFNGTDPNGLWSLYVTDDTVDDIGQFAGGWSLTITATPAAGTHANRTAITIPATTTFGAANPYPSSITVAGAGTPLTKVIVTLFGFNHTFPDDVDILLVGPSGANLIVMSDVGEGSEASGVILTLDDTAATALPDAGPLSTGTFRPTNIGPGDTFPAPAPVPSGATALSAFNGTNPNGTWSLYVVDDDDGDFGNIAGGWSLSIITTPAATPGSDFDGDGFDDLAIGVPFEDVTGTADAGAVNVLYGDTSGLGTAGAQLLHQALGTIPGFKEAGDRFGSALTAGDFNGDGFDDLAVGAPFEDLGNPPNVADLGAINVVYGSATGLDPSASSNQWIHQGLAGIGGTAEAGDRFGAALAAGDLNGDGHDDLAVGAPLEDIGNPPTATDVGGLNVIYGSPTGLTGTGNQFLFQGGVGEFTEAGDRFGSALAAGQFDAQSGVDLAVGAPGEDLTGPPLRENVGIVNIVRGTWGAPLSATGSQTWRQGANGVGDFSEPGDLFGWALAAGNFDDDAGDDLAVGAPGEDLSGPPLISDLGIVNVLYSTGVGGLVADNDGLFRQGFDGVNDFSEAGDEFGFSLASGDFDDDGADDLAVGAPFEDAGNPPTVEDHGVVQVLFGLAGGALTPTGDLLFRQGVGGVPDFTEGGDWFGYSLAVGSFDGTAGADLAAGSPHEDLGNPATVTNHGSVIVLYQAGTASPDLWRQGGAVPGDFEAGDELGSALT